MQNKGLVRTLAAILLLACMFYLSFSFVTGHYENKAKEYAQGDDDKYFNYIDSLAGEEVWLGYTLRECREKEINLGLDLKGGMNVTLEVSVADILRALSDNSQDENFNKALAATRQRQATSGENFLKIFQEEFLKIDPNMQLSAIFSTFDLKDRIQLSTSNEEVISILQGEIDAAINNSFLVLRSRIDRFGVVQPNIQRLDVEGRILVELPGIKERERVRKLLQGSANLEFWETYKFEEVYPFLEQANAIIKGLNDLKEEATKTEEVAQAPVVEEVKVDSATAATDTSNNLDLSTDPTKTEEGMSKEEMAKEYPLFALLSPQQNQGPVMGMALATDTGKVMELLSMKQVKEILPRDIQFKWTVSPINPDDAQHVYQLIGIKVTNREGKAPLSGDVITDARADFGQYTASSNVNMAMNAEGAKVWARITKENTGREIAIVLDGYVYSFPTSNGEIAGGRSEISGNFTPEEAKDLANVLKSGTMPAPARIVQEDVVGPSLGQEAIDNGFMSFAIAFCLILLYMIMYYGLIPGLIADAALVLNVFILLGVLASFKAVLTLPGIAGIVLTLGMAVDANVLIYERIREELAAGKNLKKAIKDGYSSALSAILDANITTLLTGIILAYFGTGPIKGFATTLIIGIISSVFTAVFLTRLVYDRMEKSKKERNLTFTTNITKNWFKNLNIDFVGKRKIGYIISGVVIIAAIVSLSFRGLSQGIDFSGGRNYVVRFEQTVDAEEVRGILNNTFAGSQTNVITMGEDNQVRISTNYEVGSIDENIDMKIENMLFTALKPLMNEKVTEQMFIERYVVNGEERAAAQTDDQATFGVQSSQKVGPTIADDIKTSAIWAILFSLIGIALYILIRFRNWAFSAGAVIALAHDALFILGAYSLLYSIMPFSLEIDQAFIAAILTIIGYSVNDTVVIFDRIRENLGLYPKRNLKEQINNSLNATLSRTFSTSLSTAVVLIAIFAFGGETIRGFVFALLIGIIVGTYSTLFVASPISYEIQSRQKKNKELAK